MKQLFLKFIFVLFFLSMIPVGYSQEEFLSTSEILPVEKPLPIYPRLARAKGWQGTVMLRVSIEENGTPKDISVEKTSGFKLLDETACDAIKNWKFRSLHTSRLTLPYSVLIPVQFVLKK